MFPIRDHNPSLGTPYVTYALIAANVLIFAAYWPYFADDAAIAGFFGDWAMIPAQVSGGDRVYTVLTSMFLHGSLLHLGGNMLFLWIFGDNLEDELGHIGFLIFYLLCGIGADLVQLLADPNSPIPTVGASGAIAAVMGAYLLLFPRARVDVLFVFIIFFRIFPVPAWAMLALWFGLQLFNGAASDVSMGGVAYWAHSGGFVIGFLYVIPLWLKRGGPDHWQRTRGHPPHPEARYRTTRTSIPNVRRRR
ncbi:MAG: rhomboid family intramembrane serine protease [Paracoccaceae bacterium]